MTVKNRSPPPCTTDQHGDNHARCDQLAVKVNESMKFPKEIRIRSKDGDEASSEKRLTLEAIIAGQEPLNCSDDDDDDVCVVGGGDDCSNQRRIAFHQTVTVAFIPSHTEYAQDTKAALWSSLSEISKMVDKNNAEFAAEGWDWRNALEEDDMLVVNGKVVHPVHALLRQIPYPRAIQEDSYNHSRNWLGGGEDHQEGDQDEEGGAIDLSVDFCNIERPKSNFLDDHSRDDNSDLDDSSLGDPDLFLLKRFAHHNHRTVC